MAKELTTFTDLHDFVIEQSRIGTGSAASNEVNRLINITYQDVSMEHRWRWLESSGSTVVPKVYTTGTITVSNNAATVVGVSTSFTASMVGRKIRFSADDSEYQIASRSSATRVLLTASYRGTALATAAYRIYQNLFSAPTDCEEVVDVYTHQAGWHGRKTIEPISRRQMIDYSLSTPSHEGFAHRWTHEPYTSSGTRRFSVWPAGDSSRDYRLRYEYIKQITPLSATTTSPLMPKSYRSVLAYGALEKLFMQQGIQQRAQWARAEYNSKLAKMIDDGETTDRQVKLMPRGSFRQRNRRSARRYDIDRDEYND